MMARPVAPEKLFEHAGCFYQALTVLHAVAPTLSKISTVP